MLESNDTLPPIEDKPVEERLSSMNEMVEEIKKLAEELGVEPPSPQLKEDSHFWFLVLMVFTDRRKEILETFNSTEIPAILGVDNLDLLETTIQKIALMEAMNITNAGDIDKLTGAWNRRSLEDRIIFFQNLIKEQVLDEDYIIILYFIDIDDFKKINDTHGHTIGDKVLQKFVQIAKGLIRPEDSIFRYGGEELVVLQFMNLAGLIKAAAKRDIDLHDLIKEIADDFRQEAADQTTLLLLNDGVERITTSMGVTQVWPQMNPKQAISEADELMYVAKQTGKDRIFSRWDKRPEKTFSLPKIFANLRKLFTGRE